MKLKLCPFCGRDAEFRRYGRQGHYIACKGCDSASTMFTAAKDDVRDLLTETWNRRFTPDTSELYEQVQVDAVGFLVHDKDNPGGRFHKRKPSISQDDMSEHEIWVEPLYTKPSLHEASSIRSKAIEDVLSALTAHELYRYRPRAFNGFIEYARRELGIDKQ